jgi:hypothetical protein
VWVVGSRAARKRLRSVEVQQLAGNVGEQAGARFGRSGVRFGDAPTRSAVRQP